MAVRVDERYLPGEKKRPLRVAKMTDYHTVQGARVEYSGLKSHETIQTWREYLFDAQFTIALWNLKEAPVSLDALEGAVRRPVFTPFLGRRSCPLARPPFESRLCAPSVLEALKRVHPHAGTIYSEEEEGERMIRLRDVPLIHQSRQFASRNVFVIGGGNVPE
jgi:CRISPR system Cascade subunit CasD